MHRLLDVVLSSIALVLLSPLLIAVIVLLRFTGEGEVFFLQQRVGKDGKLFKVFKFATMLKSSPNIGTGTVTLRDDPRILPVGRFLRRSKLNELPQLVNVLMGDMSFVGPRPQTLRCFEAFPDAVRQMIIRVKPGITGIGSIVFRSEERLLADHTASLGYYDSVIAPYKGSLEIWYVENRSISNYLTIIILTIWVVLVPSSTLTWRIFEGMPKPPKELSRALGYR
jgi:lipopolysaccharide/colanic/teichoic acid biosynthesis glycosyltransferase